MNGQIDLFTLLTFIVAVVAIFKLRSVLGKRTGDEDQRIERRSREPSVLKQPSEQPQSDKVVALPRRDREEPGPAPDSDVSVAEVKTKIKSMVGSDNVVSNGLLDILKKDPAFDPEHFLQGARQAYEMIVTAFAEGNRKILRDLLSESVFDSFSRAITDREKRNEQLDQSFVGILKSDVIDAELEKGTASITVRFVSQLISATRNKDGDVVDGDPAKVKEVTDLWTFCRDVSTLRARNNPNWKLVATQSPN